MSLLPPELQQALAAELNLEVQGQSPIRGGCIHKAARVDTSMGPVFVKWNHGDSAPLFAAEAEGLERLRATQSLAIPQVLAQLPGHRRQPAESHKYAALVLPFIQSTAPQDDYWAQLGRGLADLHRNTQAQFGLEQNNWIGRLPQSNTWTHQLADFWAQARLAPLIQRATEAQLLPKATRRALERLMQQLDRLLIVDSPALLHGDLWSGNVMVGPQGEPWLIDPAVYYGPREAELAFTRLFGEFDPRFYEAYDRAFALNEGWEERVDLFNLYPLLVHLNLFGTAYLGQIESILKRFG